MKLGLIYLKDGLWFYLMAFGTALIAFQLTFDLRGATLAQDWLVTPRSMQILLFGFLTPHLLYSMLQIQWLRVLWRDSL